MFSCTHPRRSIKVRVQMIVLVHRDTDVDVRFDAAVFINRTTAADAYSRCCLWLPTAILKKHFRYTSKEELS